MLYRLNTNILIIGCLTICYTIILVGARAYCAMTAGTVLAFTTQVCMLLYFSRQEYTNYTGKVLFLATLLYTTAIGAVFMGLSYYYEGDTFMFSRMDALFYYKNAMKATEIGFIKNAIRLFNTFEFDDCGALIFDSMVMYIIPDKLFLNVIYLLSGAISAVMLFRIGVHFMPEAYAFLGALTYSTSSYLIFFHCSFLKESIFVFIVICALYFLDTAIMNKKPLGLLGAGISIGLLMFFRPAVAAMIIASIMVYYALEKQGHAVSVFLYIGVFVIVLAAMQAMTKTVDRYTAGGDMDVLMENSVKENYSTGFNSFVGYFSAFFGPFPSLFPRTEGKPITINFYGAGLTFRTFLIIPFWLGVYYTVKKRTLGMVPVTVFVIFEMLASGLVMASLELRKVMPHMPFIYLLSYYGLSQLYADKMPKYLIEKSIFILSMGIMMLWVVIRE